jgi:hypothetical protein
MEIQDMMRKKDVFRFKVPSEQIKVIMKTSNEINDLNTKGEGFLK